jgi:hypothetical protein
MKQSTLGLEFVRQVLSYDPTTGIFRWLQPVNRNTAIGQIAGVVASNGRRYIGLLGEKHSAHRLAWFHYYGVWPTGNVRQENGNYDDCGIGNLAEESVVETARRGAIRVSNKSGVQGVSWSSAKKKWVAVITRDYRRVHLGYFASKDDAATAYAAALAEMPTGGSTVIPAETIAHRRRLRAIWKRALRQHHNKTGWSSFPAFVASVGDPPGTNFFIQPDDEAQVIGPTNFRWVEFIPTPKSTENRRYRQRNRDVLQARDRERKFGVSDALYQRLLVEQDGLCIVCGEPETSERDGAVKALAIDHDHESLVVRGLMCSNCNPMIGYAKEKSSSLRSAADFLDLIREIFKAQDGRCAICKTSERLIIDRTREGNIRGLLCVGCKEALVLCDDNPEIMGRAVEFLGRYRRVPGSSIEDNLWEPLPASEKDGA